jgi:glycosyltransferase involved in cell wall biosynthesis
MKFVFASYVVTKEFKHPEAWLNRIRAYTGILEALSEQHVITSIEQIDYEGESFKNGVHYHFLRSSLLSRYFPKKQHQLIKSYRPDIVVIQGLHFPLQVIQLRLKLSKKVKIILHNHAEKPFTGIKKYLQLWADRYIDAYLFASRDMGMDWVKKGNLASPQKIHEVMEVSSVFYPVDKELARSKTKISGKPVFLWVGRLNQNKDPLTVLSAFLKFEAVNPSARLYMIYHTEELLPQIYDLLNAHPDGKAVVLIGKVPNDDLLYWYNSADFILSGSHYEGSGTAICEAMSCGCVPIVTDIFSFRMITDNGNCGLLYQPGNQTELLAALMQTQKMDIQAKRAASLNYFKTNLSFEAIAKRISEIAINLQFK